ncbi:hypothetical protein AQUCO_09000005v1 [Aquilegia coerulea]|uniref:DUF7895 domain-containing protein n=1 Tax=Aquilegia coerulea TaxID=218851 RepID=A0A2G5C640_AQUCA|nr:hypothetical protein AQUCO_09000005v1 [Aquilegia coerulea]
MELTLLTLHSLSFSSSSSSASRNCNSDHYNTCYPNTNLPFHFKAQGQGTKKSIVSCALPETAVSVVLAATAVGAAATFLARRTKASETTVAEDPLKVCEDCGGSGICAECKGEGFVLKRLSDERAEKARLSAQNMATRYTAGLPKKWSYCTKCSSARSCSKCGGSGRLNW